MFEPGSRRPLWWKHVIDQEVELISMSAVWGAELLWCPVTTFLHPVAPAAAPVSVAPRQQAVCFLFQWSMIQPFQTFLFKRKQQTKREKTQSSGSSPLHPSPPSPPTLSELHQGSLTSTSLLSLFPHIFLFLVFCFFSLCRFCVLKAKLSVGPETHVRG